MKDVTSEQGPQTPDRDLGASRPGPPETPGVAEVGEEGDSGIGGKVALTLFPFVLILVLLLIEWWIRGRS